MKKLLITTIALIICSAVHGQSQSVTSALPAEAQANFDKGLAAAEQKDWYLAVQYFELARASCSCGPHYPNPKFPALYFNLGLANARFGAELPAIAWLHTYLAAAPDAQNGSEVRKEITRLEVATEIKIRKLVQMSVDGAEKADIGEITRGLIADDLAATGDIEAVRRTLHAVTLKSNPDARAHYAFYFGMKGDFYRAEAELNADSIPDASDSWRKMVNSISDDTWSKISKFWESIDTKLALEAAEHIKDAKQREEREQIARRTAEALQNKSPLEVWQQEADNDSTSWGVQRTYDGFERHDTEARLKNMGAQKNSSGIPGDVAHLATQLTDELLKIQALSKKYSSN